MTVSVIVPTYHRVALAQRLLENLQGQSVINFQLIIVDNASEPRLGGTVDDLNRRAAVQVTYVHEPLLGAHHARHAGARAATGDLLIFADDDQTFAPGWIAAYHKAFTNHPDMVAAAGPILPRWESSPPAWLVKLLAGRPMFPILGLVDYGMTFRLGPNGFIFSGNMAIRRTIFFDLGGFCPDLYGDVLLGNGENGLNHQLRRKAMLIGYVPQAVAYHHIPAERMTLNYFKRRMANEAACDMYTRFHERIPGRIALSASAFSIFFRNALVWALAWLLNGKTDRWSLQIQLQAVRSHAQLRYICRLRADEHFRSFVVQRDWLNKPCTSA